MKKGTATRHNAQCKGKKRYWERNRCDSNMNKAISEFKYGRDSK